MAKKQAIADFTITLENTVKRVRKDLFWVAVCAIISFAAGLAVGNLIRF